VFTSRDNPLISRLGLTTLEAVRTYVPTHLVKNHRGHRDILRIDTATPDGQPLTLFLKRVWRSAKKDGLKTLLRFGRVHSVCRVEWDNCDALNRAGIPTSPLVAFGEENGLLWERFSFILTAAAPGQPLEDFLRDTPLSSPLRRQTLAALAAFVRRLHHAGLFSPDLFTRHIFVANPGPNPTFTLIDMARLDRASPGSARLCARDLAALNITAPLSKVTRTERLRFLMAYDPAGAILVPRIRRRVNYLLKRRKYQPFFH
jgi:tRNA A-37 threonylcarbamoyl transferase component Bud32